MHGVKTCRTLKHRLVIKAVTFCPILIISNDLGSRMSYLFLALKKPHIFIWPFKILSVHKFILDSDM